MRVISGAAKGRKLKLVPGSGTRPITDRVKENLFNLLQWEVRGSRFLDLFAGTGSVGIEALSRGALEVTFLDTAREAIATVRANLDHCRLASGARVVRMDAFAFLSKYSPEPYDIIFAAPPQYRDLWSQAVTAVDRRSGWLSEDGVVVAQMHPKEYRELSLESLELVDQRAYGSTMLCLYRLGLQD